MFKIGEKVKVISFREFKELPHYIDGREKHYSITSIEFEKDLTVRDLGALKGKHFSYLVKESSWIYPDWLIKPINIQMEFEFEF